jgi:hypothetical protein
VTIYVSARNVAEVNRQSRELLERALAALAVRRQILRTFAVTGSRTWTDWRVMWSVLDLVPAAAEMFNGWADGADCLARSFWLTQDSPVRPFKANWKGIGNRAGVERNTLMMESMPQLVLAFLCSDGPSRGTRDAIAKAQERGIPVFTFHQYVPASGRG